VKPFIQLENNAKAGAYWAAEPWVYPKFEVINSCEFSANAAPSSLLEQAIQAELFEQILRQAL